jgi:hypothetical protein
MKSPKFSQWALMLVLFVASTFYYKNIYGNRVSALLSADTSDSDGTATNCTYTGNSSDYCNASDGTHNLKVTNCRPGSTSCGYDTSAL